MKDIGTHVGCIVLKYGAGLVGGRGRDANVLLSCGTVVLCNGGALRDSRSAGPMCLGGCPLMCGGMCVR